MSTRLRAVVAGCVTASLVLLAGPAAAAAPEPVSSVERSGALSNQEARDLVAFFVLGAGPMMATHGGLASDLGIQDQQVPTEIVDALFDRLVAVDPDLAASVVQLGSGDPVVVNQALERLKSAVTEVLTQDGEVRSAGAGAGAGDGRGLIWNVNHFVTTNVGAAVNLAVAVVLATAVTLAVPVALFSSAAGGGRYDQELFALKIAERL